ncbi:hypothetical protein HO133_006224 [Letharia lupina]|uniref:Uncharacterized protein n=1 Tax=Letharia lupina TaxID=560253 RepID=A0A8H6C7E5_9LECA|nr:uncharacterized protein HO133_006224 [Letharia lupina]KAF6218262.1 hypothetical protein HO133_006224 [Letharia lupina]
MNVHSRASREIIEHNDQRRSPSSCEQDAIRCLARALDEAESGPWGPDLIIKCFCDLDIVFFGGVLQGNVRVGWGSAHELAMLEEALRDNYGITIHTQPGRVDIFLNARGIFSNPNAAVSLFRAIFSTMLHEMCTEERTNYLDSKQLKRGNSIAAAILGVVLWIGKVVVDFAYRAVLG